MTHDNGGRADNRADDGDTTRSGSHTTRPTPMEVLRKAGARFRELTGLAAESVTSFSRSDDGWALEVEVLELSRVPDTMSLLATYQVHLDEQGELIGYRRVRRYERGRAGLG